MNSYNGFTSAQRNATLAWAKRNPRPIPVACIACGQPYGELQRHSEDYSKPYGWHIGAYHLCYFCHMMLHCRFKKPERFEAYCTALRAGLRFDPVGTFPGVCRYLRGENLQHTVQGPIRQRIVFDDILAGIVIKRGDSQAGMMFFDADKRRFVVCDSSGEIPANIVLPPYPDAIALRAIERKRTPALQSSPE